ncbi:MAG: thioredoxin family protein, partial [Gammaproteobacteria bacterium]|nr:thioredoxin family protein [Gammaproteobacteria bacterium]
MKLLNSIYFVILVLISQAVFAESKDPYKYFFNESWGDYKEELVKAKAQGKKGIMIFFEMDECPFCHYMKTNVLNQADVQEYFRQYFLLFSVDV